ncbi:hypothetical protein RRG08_052025, partial [Elysia crispata]
YIRAADRHKPVDLSERQRRPDVSHGDRMLQNCLALLGCPQLCLPRLVSRSITEVTVPTAMLSVCLGDGQS